MPRFVPPPPTGTVPPVDGPLAPAAPTPPAAAAVTGAALARAARPRAPWTALAIVFASVVVVAGVIGAVLVVVTKDDKPTRSVEAFCSTMKSEQKRIIDEFESSTDAAQASGDDFAEAFLTIGASVQALGELQTYFSKLAKVAPEEIQTEAEIVADKIGDVLKAPDLSFEGIAGSMMASMEIAGPINTLDTFAKEHCGQSI
jgi:hypothetical protein